MRRGRVIVVALKAPVAGFYLQTLPDSDSSEVGRFPRKRRRAGNRRVGGPGLQGGLLGWQRRTVGPVPSPGGLRLGKTVQSGFTERLRIYQDWTHERLGAADL